jgi:hypothetical protein
LLPLPELHLAIFATDDLPPGQGDEFGDAQAASICNLNQYAIAGPLRVAHKQTDLDLADDALRDRPRVALHLDDGAGVERQIPEPVPVGEQRLDAQHDLSGARRRQAGRKVFERGAHVLDGSAPQRDPESSEEALRRPLAVAPAVHRVERRHPGRRELLVVGRLRCRDRTNRRRHDRQLATLYHGSNLPFKSW